MGSLHSRPCSNTSPLSRLSSLTSSLAWHLSFLLSRFYNLLLSPLFHFEGSATSSFSHKHKAQAWGRGEGIIPVRYRPDRGYKQRQDVERRRRRATDAAEKASEGLLNGADDDEEEEGSHDQRVAGTGRGDTSERQDILTPLENAGEAATEAATKAAKRRSAPPRYAPRATSNVLTGEEDPPLHFNNSEQQHTRPSAGHDQPTSALSPVHSPMPKVKNRAVSASPIAPQLARPSRAVLEEFKTGSSGSPYGEITALAMSPRASSETRRQAMTTFGSASNLNLNNATRPPSFDSPAYQLPLSRTSTGLGGGNSPRTSISDLASAACSRKNAAKERKLWRVEIDKVAKRKVAGAANVTGGKRSSLGLL